MNNEINNKNNPIIKLVRKQQAGFSLIELLVSSLIGLFLIGGIITNFVTTKDSERVRSAISQMDADARAAMDILRVTVAHGGYGGIHINSNEMKAFFTQNDDALQDRACRSGEPFQLFHGGASGTGSASTIKRTQDGVKSDRMTVVYAADNPCGVGATDCETGSANSALVRTDVEKNKLVYYDCLGGGFTRNARTVACSTDSNGLGMFNTPQDAKIYSSFFIDGTKHGSVSTPGLWCRGSATGQKAELVENITAMQIRYGVKRGTAAATQSRYLTATQLDADEDSWSWADVRNVQIALLVRSFDANVLKNDVKTYKNSDTVSGKSKKLVFDLLGQKVTVFNQDKRMYRVYTSTVQLANQNREVLRQL